MRELLGAMFGGVPARVECETPDYWERVGSFTAEGYRLRARLAVHEARTEAEMGSAVTRHARPTGRGKQRRVA